ncbi:EF hand [Alteromonadaceae bacterium Bs31]|nr:EF hand [Alteromonadaceae bacterium Bs31]
MARLSGLRVLLGAVFTGCMLSGTLVAAQETAAGDLWLLAKYDGNGDKIITVDEISEKRKEMFSRMDDNADGDVSFEEYLELDAAKRQMLLKARFNKLDLDQDGNLSGEEYCSYLGSFERFDQNGDGNITSQEMNSGAGEKVDIAKNTEEADENTHCLFWVCIRTDLD